VPSAICIFEVTKMQTTLKTAHNIKPNTK